MSSEHSFLSASDLKAIDQIDSLNDTLRDIDLSGDPVTIPELADAPTPRVRLTPPSAKGALEKVPGKQNWVDRVGGFPPGNWIYRCAIHLHRKGFTVGHAIATAINAAKKGCATGDLNWPGWQGVNMASRAQMCAAVAQWEAMKARA